MITNILLERRLVYGWFQRFLHLSIGLGVSLLGVTGWGAEFFEKGLYEKAVWQIHIIAGYWLIGAMSLRLLWGFVGPTHAKWKDSWHLKSWITRNWSPRWGHDVRASLAYLLLYLFLVVMAMTGLGLTAVEHDQGVFATLWFDRIDLGENFESVHEFFALAVAGFVVLHLGGMYFHEKWEGRPVFQSMWSGFQYRRIENEKDGTNDTHSDQ
jgi:Ni/Fe-hydrogenase 1 B-type cytochrome subunit